MAKFKTEREILNMLKWDKKFDFDKVRIGYLHNNSLIYIEAYEIVDKDQFSFCINVKNEEGYIHDIDIPFHRIKEIYYEKVLIWKREWKKHF